ncbi:MAG: aminotransferase class I/II-fold pyridoxal phosphate-dependent enzyme [Nitrososphaeraceae archaeon]
MKISDRISNVEYAIRDIIVHAREYGKHGKEIIYLNIGDPVKYDFHTPDHIKKALVNAVLSDENYYTDSEGLPELRHAIVEKEKTKGLSISDDDVLVTNGVSEALDMTMASILNPGDEVLMPGPYYPPYASYVKFYGGKPVEFKINHDGSPDLEDLKRKISPRSTAICIINPNNPTGEVFSFKHLKEITELAAQYDLYIICDEIYDKIIFDDTFSSIGSVAKDLPVILLNGFSKVYLMSGWRCGYLCINNSSSKLDDFRNNVPKLARVRISTNLPVQYAAVNALRGPQDHIQSMVFKLKRRRDYVVKRLNSISGISCTLPRGAFYVFPKIGLENYKNNDLKFVIDLLNNTGILTVHGSGFGSQFGAGHFRIVYLPSENILEDAMNKLETYIKAISK